MRQVLEVCVLLALLAVVAHPADKPQSVEELRSSAEAADGEHCTRVCVEAAKAITEEANQFFTDGKVQQGHADIKDAVRFAQKAAVASVQSRKKQKQTEIALRKLERRILDIMETLNFEDKPQLQQAADAIDKSRASILTAMFDLDKDPKDKDRK